MEQENKNNYQKNYRINNKVKTNHRNKRHKFFIKEDVIDKLVNQYLKKNEGSRN